MRLRQSVEMKLMRIVILVLAVWLFVGLPVTAARAAEPVCQYTWVWVAGVWRKVIIRCVEPPPPVYVCGGCHG